MEVDYEDCSTKLVAPNTNTKKEGTNASGHFD